MFFKKSAIYQKIAEQINKAMELGLPEKDINIAKEYLDYNEYEVSFNHIVTQLYEYAILIDQPFYDLTLEIADLMKIPENEYGFLKELIPGT